jgi:hypothetical protein
MPATKSRHGCVCVCVSVCLCVFLDLSDLTHVTQTRSRLCLHSRVPRPAFAVATATLSGSATSWKASTRITSFLCGTSLEPAARRLTRLCVDACAQPLPGKQRLNVTDHFKIEFLEERRKGLQQFLNRVAEHPVLSASTLFVLFLQAPSYVRWLTGVCLHVSHAISHSQELTTKKKADSKMFGGLADSFRQLTTKVMLKDKVCCSCVVVVVVSICVPHVMLCRKRTSCLSRRWTMWTRLSRR